eukprot:c28656_g1_i1 orf=167-1234(-)
MADPPPHPATADAYGAAFDIVYSFAPTMVSKAAILLGIPNILANAGVNAELTVEQIAAQLPSQCPDLNYLSRILRFLGSKGILTFSSSVENAEERQYRYGLTDTARVFVDNPGTLSPFLLFEADKTFQSPWHILHQCVLEGGDAFEKAHGKDLWTTVAENEHVNDVFNAAMVSLTASFMPRVFEFYDGFKHVHSLVDVGGGRGQALSLIVKAFPQIQGINFDLPRVIASAPSIPGVRHVEGSMFESVPSADAVLLKSVLHNWDDENCRQILWNCRKALPAKGRVIITDIVIDETNLCSPVQQRKLAVDLAIVAVFGKGKERTEKEWRRLLTSAGFSKVEIYGIQSLFSVLETFTD